jgi:TPR repeat protein
MLALMAEQRTLEEERQRREEQARLAEKQKLDEERQKEQAKTQKPSERKSKPAPPPEIAMRPPPPVLPVESPSSEAQPVVTLAKPKPDPQAEELKRGEAALARGEYEKARDILTPLATEGNARAQIRLAEMYAFGQGVKQNTIQSYIWYSLAAQGGNTGAMAGRDRMAARLQPAEIKQAEKVVESMRPR